jgi:hypothetical protein
MHDVTAQVDDVKENELRGSEGPLLMNQKKIRKNYNIYTTTLLHKQVMTSTRLFIIYIKSSLRKYSSLPL